MIQSILIGVGAGVVAALLFASIASGALISLLLFYLAPLPILIAGLGWSHWVGLLAAFVASTTLAAGASAAFEDVSPTYLFLECLLAIGLPAWWFSYLALLARPVSTSAGSTLEWYPVGRLVVWIAIVSAAIVAAALLSVGTNEEMLRDRLREGIENYLRRTNPSFDASSLRGADPRVDALLFIGPPAVGVIITLVNLVLVWLAGHIVKVSNRLRRPWPELSAMALPAFTAALLASACAGIFVAGLPGIASSVFAVSLATIYAVLGFAVLHFITHGLNNRGLLLASAYTAVVMLWPVLVLVALLGLADAAFDIRGRFGRRTGPPTIPT